VSSSLLPGLKLRLEKIDKQNKQGQVNFYLNCLSRKKSTSTEPTVEIISKRKKKSIGQHYKKAGTDSALQWMKFSSKSEEG